MHQSQLADLVEKLGVACMHRVVWDVGHRDSELESRKSACRARHLRLHGKGWVGTGEQRPRK